MTEIKRDKKRVKKTGEVFTPPSLIDEILTRLPEEMWEPHRTFIDNSAGDGNMIIRIISWKVSKGSTIEQAMSTTFAVEYMEDNVKRLRERVLEVAENLDHTIMTIEEAREKYGHIIKKNIVHHDALTYDYSFNGTNKTNQECIQEKFFEY
jgi:hypothetical protein